jgi:two-component system, sporulation sensor kinase D
MQWKGRGAISVEVSRDGEKVCIDVSDTGKGNSQIKIQNSVQSWLYDQKNADGGLGLSLVKRIVEEYHHGSIVVKRSELGKGTTFRIQLKAVDMKD